MQLVTVENKSTVVTEAEHQQIVEALALQLANNFNRCGWVKRGLAPAGTVQALASGSQPPAGAWNLILLDHSDQQGALGYHDDEQGTPIPYAEVFAVDAANDGEPVSGVASHELLEMLCDPFVDPMAPKTMPRPGTNKRYIVEVCDPVQGAPYDPGNGVPVSDFVLPSWFEVSSYRPTSFRGTVTEPWEIAPQGYISIEKPDGSWTQIFGERRTSHPAWASRLPRIHPVVR